MDSPKFAVTEFSEVRDEFIAVCYMCATRDHLLEGRRNHMGWRSKNKAQDKIVERVKSADIDNKVEIFQEAVKVA